MKILVTGGSGFIGMNLVQLLQAEGHDVGVLDVSRSKVLDQVGHAGPRFLGADVRSPGGVWQIVRDADAVVHLAAMSGILACQESPAEAFEVNVAGTLNVLEACRRSLALAQSCRRFVLASSAAAPASKTIYGAQKRSCEALATSYHHAHGLDTVSLRFTNIYGPWSDKKITAVPAMLSKVLAGEELEISGNGQQARDFIHVEDVCHAILAAVTAPDVDGEVVGVGTGNLVSINELVDDIEAVHGSPVRRRNGNPRQGEQDAHQDLAKTKRVLRGWKANKTLRDGLQETYDWYVNRPPEPAAGPDVVEPSLVKAFPINKQGLHRIVFDDEQGARKTSDISRAACQLRVDQLTNQGPSKALREFTWMLQHIPETE